MAGLGVYHVFEAYYCTIDILKIIETLFLFKVKFDKKFIFVYYLKNLNHLNEALNTEMSFISIYS